MSKLVVKAISAIFVILFLAGCSASYRDHGYLPSQEKLDKVVIGVDTRATLSEVIGAPQSFGMLEDGNWYYMTTRIRTFGAYEPTVVDRELLAISFNRNGTVSNIEKFGLEDGKVVTLSRRVTDQPIKAQGFLKQIFGNLGNFNAGDFLN